MSTSLLSELASVISLFSTKAVTFPCFTVPLWTGPFRSFPRNSGSWLPWFCSVFHLTLIKAQQPQKYACRTLRVNARWALIKCTSQRVLRDRKQNHQPSDLPRRASSAIQAFFLFCIILALPFSFWYKLQKYSGVYMLSPCLKLKASSLGFLIIYPGFMYPH